MKVRREYDNATKLWRVTILDQPGNTVLIDRSLGNIEQILEWAEGRRVPPDRVPPDSVPTS